MKSDQFMKGQYAVDPSRGKDGFSVSRFPSMKVVAKKNEVKKINRLFQSQTAFMAAMGTSDARGAEESQKISTGALFPKVLLA